MGQKSDSEHDSRIELENEAEMVQNATSAVQECFWRSIHNVISQQSIPWTLLNRSHLSLNVTTWKVDMVQKCRYHGMLKSTTMRLLELVDCFAE